MIVFYVFFDVVRLPRMRRQSAKPDPKSFFFLIYVRASENQRSKNEAWLHNVEARPDFIHENSGLLGFGGLNLNRRSPTAFFQFIVFLSFTPWLGFGVPGSIRRSPAAKNKTAPSQRHEFRCTKNFTCQAPIFMISKP